MARRHLVLGLVCAAVAVGCTATTDDGRARGRVDDDGVLVVASFDFPESRLLAEIYAQALDHADVPVRRELELGPRELVAPALHQGFVDLVPEYLGSALASLDPPAASTTRNEAEVRAALTRGLARHDVRVLTPAPAQNQNAVVVTRATAERLGLGSVSDLGPVATSLTIGGPPECPSRRYCLVGLGDRYALRFRRFLPFDGATLIRRALEDEVIDVGILFTTDGHLATRELVALADDRHLQPPENVVPVVREETLRRHGPRVVAVVDRVSARLTTTALRLLNWRVSVAGNDPTAEARAWLIRRGLLPRRA